MDKTYFELPFKNESFDERRNEQFENVTDDDFDSWLESLRS